MQFNNPIKAFHKPEIFVCPNEKCGKTFDKPIQLIDTSKIPRETYHACPHCLSEVSLTVSSKKDVGAASAKTSRCLEERLPMKCPQHFELLRNLPKNALTPEECLICPSILTCYLRKEFLPNHI
jgi:hypothetical protein